MTGKFWQPNHKPLFSRGGRQAPFTLIESVKKGENREGGMPITTPENANP